MSFSLDDYVDVAERERLLFERYPDARVQVDLVEVRTGDTLTGWAAKATIWRTPDDPIPVCDWAVEPVPGKTPYTKDSEAMNASTSAVGRAIVLAGFPSKKIASADEVRARSGAGTPTAARENAVGSAGTSAGSTPAPDNPAARAQAAQEEAKAARTPTDAGHPSDVVIHFGKNAGTPLGSLSDKQLAWYSETWEPKDNPQDRRLKLAAKALHTGDINNLWDVPFE